MHKQTQYQIENRWPSTWDTFCSDIDGLFRRRWYNWEHAWHLHEPIIISVHCFHTKGEPVGAEVLQYLDRQAAQ